jgi:glyceraldehyde 3-phosphate dehydrogenase
MSVQRTLGINGLGRIGKLVLWYHLGRDDFDRLVVNVGRPVGKSLDAVVQYIAKDSTYGPLHRYLFGQAGVRDIRVVDEERGLISAHGKEIVVLREARDPRDIPWRDHGVSLVVECTGTFRDPHAEPDVSRGSLRGHLAAGARVVVQSSPFKRSKAPRSPTTPRSSSTASTIISSTPPRTSWSRRLRARPRRSRT